MPAPALPCPQLTPSMDPKAGSGRTANSSDQGPALQTATVEQSSSPHLLTTAAVPGGRQRASTLPLQKQRESSIITGKKKSWPSLRDGEKCSDSPPQISIGVGPPSRDGSMGRSGGSGKGLRPEKKNGSELAHSGSGGRSVDPSTMTSPGEPQGLKSLLRPQQSSRRESQLSCFSGWGGSGMTPTGASESDGVSTPFFQVGDRVRVRDSRREAWQYGSVLSLQNGRPRVVLDAQRKGRAQKRAFCWNFVEHDRPKAVEWAKDQEGMGSDMGSLAGASPTTEAQMDYIRGDSRGRDDRSDSREQAVRRNNPRRSRPSGSAPSPLRGPAPRRHGPGAAPATN